jgi:hypothetical protein
VLARQGLQWPSAGRGPWCRRARCVLGGGGQGRQARSSGHAMRRHGAARCRAVRLHTARSAEPSRDACEHECRGPRARAARQRVRAARQCARAARQCVRAARQCARAACPPWSAHPPPAHALAIHGRARMGLRANRMSAIRFRLRNPVVCDPSARARVAMRGHVTTWVISAPRSRATVRPADRTCPALES